MISVEWIKNKLGNKIYAVSHAKAVIRNENSTVDDDLAAIEAAIGTTDISDIADGTISGAIRLIADTIGVGDSNTGMDGTIESGETAGADDSEPTEDTGETP